MKRRIIAALMALCLCIGLLPATALAVDTPSDSHYVTANYDTGALRRNITVNVYDERGTLVDTVSINDAKVAAHRITISLTEQYASEYDIEDVSHPDSAGTFTNVNVNRNSCSFDTTGAEGSNMIVSVQLCPEFEKPDIEGGWIDTDGVIYYRVTQAALLKLLHDNGVDVDANTKITKQQAVKAHFVDPYNGVNSEWPFDEKPAGGNLLQWYWIEEGLTDYSDLGNPNNIRYIEITYQQGDGEEQTQKIYSGDLRYVNVGGNTYEIESNKNTDEHIVIFYQETSSDSMVWEPLDVRFIDHDDPVGTLPEPPTYITDYDFVAWTQEYDGGLPVLETTYVKDDMNVFPQYTRTNLAQRIHVMNNDELLQERLEELFAGQLQAGDAIAWDTLKITVHGVNGEQTNPDYYISESDHNKWDDDYGYYLVYNYGGGGGLQENESLPISDIAKITVTVDTVDEDRLDPVTIERGPYAGDFSVSTGAHEDSWLIELYINSENDYPEDPDPEPGDDYAITDVTKTLVDTAEKAEAAGISGEYDYPDPVNGNKVIIPEDDTVTLLYAITVEGKPGASFTVTDEDATLVAIGSVAITQTDDTFTGSIPADAASITFYVSKTFDADNLESASEGDGTVLKNTATVAGNADPNEDEDTEETPAEEEDPTKPDFDDDVLAGVTVQVLCVQKPTDHKYVSTLDQHPEAYETKIEPCADDEKVNGVLLPDGFDWKCTVSISKEYFVKYFNDVAKLQSNLWGEHELAESKKTTEIVLYYGSLGWERLGSASPVIIQVREKNAGTYTLTYDANGGKINGKDAFDVNNITPLDPTNYELGEDTGYADPKHDDVDDKTVLFAGWTLTNTERKIYSVEDAKNGSVPAAVDAVDLTETKTVYALWSYDADDDGTPDINEIIVTPADITIYTGGSDYEGGIVDEDGNKLAGSDSNGFPEPGFYITLPTALNDQLRGGITGPVNLSEKLSFVYENEATQEGRQWTLKMYNPDTDAESNIAYKKFIYQLEPGAAQDPVRLLIKDAVGNEQSSDRFEFDANTLYQEYTMTIYGGENVETNEVQAVIEGDTYSVFVDTGDLTVRGVNDATATSEVAEQAPETVSAITAVADSDTTYYINDSAIPVRKDAAIHLLADELADTPQALTAAAEKAINGAIVDPEYDFMYLDLVDNSNGNAYVTLNKDGEADTVTIHWPIPDDADPDGKFYVVHFDGLDREYDVTDLDDLLNNPENPDKVQVITYTKTDDSLKVSKDGKSVSFETSTFSPFALVYEKTSTPMEQVTVTFEVVNGTWRNGSSQNIVYTINKGTTLAANSIAVPTGMRPNSGYEGGSWDTTPNTTTTLNGNVTYTYRFTRSGGGEYNPKDATLRFNSRGGTEFDDIVRNDPFEYNPYNKIPSRPGYRFTGWYDSSRLDNRYDEDEEISVPMGITTVWAGWDETSVPSMLNGDDHYAYIQGYSDGTVRPNANITRAQVATIFFRLLDEDVRDDNLTTYNTFPDVDEDYWANTAISTMASLGVINGRNSGLFDPDAYITRAEFAAICARFDDSGVDGITTFTDTVGHWAEDEISRAAALGWIQGYSDGTFRPNQYITRAQAVTMINRVLCRLPEDTDDLLSGMNTWTDCHEDDWFYLAIQEATNSHDFVAKDRVYESWTDLNRAPDWSRYE